MVVDGSAIQDSRAFVFRGKRSCRLHCLTNEVLPLHELPTKVGVGVDARAMLSHKAKDLIERQLPFGFEQQVGNDDGRGARDAGRTMNKDVSFSDATVDPFAAETKVGLNVLDVVIPQRDALVVGLGVGVSTTLRSPKPSQGSNKVNVGNCQDKLDFEFDKAAWRGGIKIIPQIQPWNNLTHLATLVVKGVFFWRKPMAVCFIVVG